MKKYIHIKEKKVPLYRGALVIMLSNSRNKIREFIPDFETKNPYAHAWHYNYGKKEAFIMVLNLDSEYRKVTHGCISHEAIHLANMVLDSRGLKPDYDNDEAQAYLVEWITDQAYKFIKKKGYKIGTKEK